jgi:transcriptional regulator with XRE-family HTH domain
MDKYNQNIKFPKTDKREVMKKMSTNLKQIREASGLQQKEMAILLGYTVTSYNKIENGERRLPISKAIKAAEILKCSLDEIFLPSNFPKWTKGDD